MITDRRRYAGAEPPSRAALRRPGDALVQRVAAAAAAGVNLVQVRERDLEARDLTRLVARCVTAVRDTRTRILVNDRLDVALAAGAHGVHLRADSLPASRARALAPIGFLIGRSVHSRAEAVAACADGGVDYLLFGTVFPTGSKPGQAPAGVQALAEVVEATPVPVLAVGGVSPDTAHQLAGTGCAGFAAIGWFADGDDARVADLRGVSWRE
jgi:thiamine-phosphate pyrophosphorylase